MNVSIFKASVLENLSTSLTCNIFTIEMSNFGKTLQLRFGMQSPSHMGNIETRPEISRPQFIRLQYGKISSIYYDFHTKDINVKSYGQC